MTQAYAQLVDHLGHVRASWRARRGLEGVLLAASCALGALAVAALVDQLLDPSGFGRLLLSAVVYATAIGAAWRWMIRPMTLQPSDDYFAALVEERLPQLGNRLINALQLGRQSNGHAPRIIEAIVHDGVRAVEAVDVTRATATPALRQRAIGLGAVLLAAVVYVLAAGPGARVSLARVLLPLADIRPFTWTQVTIDMGAADRLLEGSPLTVTATTSGRTPDAATLHWTDAQGIARAVAMSPASRPGVFEHTFAAVEASMTLHARAGDGQSDPLTIHVDPRPRIARMTAVVTPPAYAGLAPLTFDEFDGHLHALPGSKATITLETNKPMEHVLASLGNGPAVPIAAVSESKWQIAFDVTEHSTYGFTLRDTQGYEAPSQTYTITLDRDVPPAVAIAHPGRDIQVGPDAQVSFVIVSTDDLGVGPIELLGWVNPAPGSNPTPTVIHAWPAEGAPQKRVEHTLHKSVKELGLSPGDRLQYWAVAFDRNDVAPQPGRAQTRMFNIVVLTPEAAAAAIDQQLSDYAKVIEELIRLQRLNRVESAGYQPAAALVDRQSLIRRQTLQLAAAMESAAFPGVTIIEALRALAADEMASVLSLLETFRDRADKPAADRSLPIQDAILARLEDLLDRLNRNEKTREALKKLQKTDSVEHGRTLATLEKVAAELDQFLAEMRDVEEKYERLAKRNVEELTGEDLAQLNDVQTRLDRWKQWAKDSVDEITKLPQGFVADSHLAEDVNTIFEEIEKKQRPPTIEIATPVEEGVKVLAESVLEDLEMWNMDIGDNLKWVMEDPTEGTFEVPEAKLPESLQDMVGDLIEDLEEFDEEADDTTGAWGGSMQVGWAIMDGPISSFAALGKTGNQMPNASEMGGRSGAGRRGRSSGQMVGENSPGYEGRPTPARVTNERYEQGNVNASKQLDPRGATGGGKKTGAGRRGLQGGTPPDFTRDMDRLEQTQAVLRERAMKVANQLDYAGRPSSQVNRALQLLDSAAQDLRDLRYEDAARKRKVAIGELKSAHSGIDQAVSLTLQKAIDLPPELRQEIATGAQQALPEGYEQLVGEYYKALSTAGSDE